MQRSKNGLLFAGITCPTAGPFSGGTLCVNQPNKRGPVMNFGGTSPSTCDGLFQQVINDLVIPFGLAAPPGQTAWYPWWYRDPHIGPDILGIASATPQQCSSCRSLPR